MLYVPALLTPGDAHAHRYRVHWDAGQDNSMDVDYVELVTGLSKMADGKQEDKVRRRGCGLGGGG